MSPSKRTVTREEWIAARKALLAKEKEFTRERDALSALRRELPRVLVDKRYVFQEPSGERTLGDLFDGRRQLVVYHFMLEPTWDEGCRGCSFVADSVQVAPAHLAARDTSFAAVSRAPLAKIEPFKKRMGWTFRWLSSGEGDFNYDFGASFRADDVAAKTATYNYDQPVDSASDLPGLSVFLREGDAIFHTYSTYGRGLDLLIGTYNLLDLTPLGRQEEGLPQSMAWLRHHDKYGAELTPIGRRPSARS